ncbi:hypothetical protein Y017_02395 [Alcanivorax sp. 97CO-5]|uniref:acyltransferase n=1 Tax=unclassified Alcanivorax TaxID=2638842 RepID=UPI0003E804AC|nr:MULTISPECIES: acyltransferase [unclassified Alcanivorax]EUC71718.1 hypothetical protein Y017_02395 [Alcanivorax sp. 97CO-5]PKG03055.1 acyltransferase [Alcanivorax sp. 97CO-6]
MHERLGFYRRKAKTFFVYVVLFHFVKLFCDVLIPNFHVGNLVRGKLLGLFFKSAGRRLSVASGCIFNGVWNLEIEDDVYIAHNCWINAVGGLKIKKGSIFSPNVVVATTAHGRENGRVSLRRSNLSAILIGEGVWVASNSVITKGSVLGKGAVISACSVVRGEVKSGGLYSGNPACFVKKVID